LLMAARDAGLTNNEIPVLLAALTHALLSKDFSVRLKN
jgi:hypothetical protein